MRIPFLVAIMTAIILCMCSCDEDNSVYVNSNKITKNGGGGSEIVVQTIPMSEQTIDVVDVDNIVTWLKSHTNIIIDTMTCVDNSGYGRTSGFIIVYHKSTKPMPVEKTARQVALDKLTEADKQALDIK